MSAPRSARFTLFCPRFCPTKVVEAIESDCIGRRTIISIFEYAVQPPIAAPPNSLM